MGMERRQAAEKSGMNTKTRAFVFATIALGTCLVAYCAAREAAAGLSGAYLACVAMAMIASAFKVRLPGVHGTLSVSFLFILAAIALFGFEETVLLASTAAIVQCLWRSRTRAKLLQVAFNVAVLAISSGAAFRLAHFFGDAPSANLAVLMTLAACFYFTADTLLISGVLSLVQGKSLFIVWQQCYLWSFPYYLAGAALAALMVQTNRSAGGLLSLVVLVPMGLIYAFYRLCALRAEKSLALAQ